MVGIFVDHLDHLLILITRKPFPTGPNRTAAIFFAELFMPVLILIESVTTTSDNQDCKTQEPFPLDMLRCDLSSADNHSSLWTQGCGTAVPSAAARQSNRYLQMD